MRKEESEEKARKESKEGGGKQTDPEVAMRLTQRLYASYTDSGLLIPNEVRYPVT